MALASWRTELIFLFILCVKSIPLYIKTNVGDQTDLPCNKTCDGLVRWVHSMTSIDSTQRSIEEVIAEFKNTEFSTPTKYDKVKKGNTAYSITLMPTEYNHNGVYVCSCDNEPLLEVDLKVIYHIDKLCYVGENVTLNFFEETKGLDYNRIDLYWKKYGQPVVTITGRNTVYSKGFENRLSVNKDALETGIFSLTLTSVNSSDGGLYELDIIVDEERLASGRPQAYKLTVQVSPAAPYEETAEPFCNNLILKLCLTTFVCTLLLVIGIGVPLVKYTFLSRFFSSKQEGHHRPNVPGIQVTSDECVALSSSVQEQGVPEQLSTVKPTEGDKM